MARVIALNIIANEKACQFTDKVERLFHDDHAAVRSFALKTVHKLDPDRV